MLFGAGTGAVVVLAAGNGVVNGGQLGSLGWYSNNYATGIYPTGVVFDRTNIWVANTYGNSVTKLSGSTGALIGTYNLASGSQPVALAFDGTYVWTANSGTNNVTKITASNGAIVGTYATGNMPYGIVFDGTYIWTANYSGTVTKLSTAGSVQATYTAAGAPYAIAYDGTAVWTANSVGDSVTRIGPVDAMGTIGVNTYPLEAGSKPRGIAFDGINIWTANNNGKVAKLSLAGAVLAYYPTTPGGNSIGIAFDQPGYSSNANRQLDPKTYLWVANFGNGSVSKVDVLTGAVVANYPVGKNPFGIVFDGNNIWVANANSNSVTKIAAR